MIADKKLLNIVRDKVQPVYSQMKCWAHGWPHVISVEATSERLAKMEGEDPIYCGVAAYCHDLGRAVEEKIGQVNRALGRQNHSFLSVEPTIKVLNETGIAGEYFDKIVGAVAMHSEKTYSGENLVAKIIRDADKKDGLGPWGVLRMARFIFEMDFGAPNPFDKEEVMRLSEEVLKRIFEGKESGKFQGDLSIEEYLKCSKFNLEWYDMLDTKSAATYLRGDYEYIRETRKRAIELIDSRKK